MTNSILRPIFFTLIIFCGSTNSYSQSLEEKISTIDKNIQFINENVDDRNILKVIHADGEVIKRNKVFGLFKTTKVNGVFAETLIIKDSLLIRATEETRIFLNKGKSISTNTIEEFVYVNEKLCYYYQKKIHENKNRPDSLIYEIEYYIENGKILLPNMKGDINQNVSEILERIIKNSESKIEDKNRFQK